VIPPGKPGGISYVLTRFGARPRSRRLIPKESAARASAGVSAPPQQGAPHPHPLSSVLSWPRPPRAGVGAGGVERGAGPAPVPSPLANLRPADLSADLRPADLRPADLRPADLRPQGRGAVALSRALAVIGCSAPRSGGPPIGAVARYGVPVQAQSPAGWAGDCARAGATDQCGPSCR
jgi:hypothetical protein